MSCLLERSLHSIVLYSQTQCQQIGSTSEAMEALTQERDVRDGNTELRVHFDTDLDAVLFSFDTITYHMIVCKMKLYYQYASDNN